MRSSRLLFINDRDSDLDTTNLDNMRDAALADTIVEYGESSSREGTEG